LAPEQILIRRKVTVRPIRKFLETISIRSPDLTETVLTQSSAVESNSTENLRPDSHYLHCLSYARRQRSDARLQCRSVDRALLVHFSRTVYDLVFAKKASGSQLVPSTHVVQI